MFKYPANTAGFYLSPLPRSLPHDRGGDLGRLRLHAGEERQGEVTECVPQLRNVLVLQDLVHLQADQT